MENKPKTLDARGKGESRYNYRYDILFFKIKGRDYLKSLDFGDIIVDIDTEGFITGIQIFDASNMFKLDKLTLREIKNWEFKTKAQDRVITIQLMFVMVRRNKQIVQRGENLVRETVSQLEDAEVLCTVPTR